MRVTGSMVPKVQRYEPMTGITQSFSRAQPRRPKTGIPSMQFEEKAIRRELYQCGAERVVEDLWPTHSPERIAGLLHARYPHAMNFITARWVESIKRRIDNRKR